MRLSLFFLALLVAMLAASQWGESKRAFVELSSSFRELAERLMETQAESPVPVKRASWTSGGIKIEVEVPRIKKSDGTWQSDSEWREAFRQAVEDTKADFPVDPAD